MTSIPHDLDAQVARDVLSMSVGVTTTRSATSAVLVSPFSTSVPHARSLLVLPSVGSSSSFNVRTDGEEFVATAASDRFASECAVWDGTESLAICQLALVLQRVRV
jgi:hypothetical protein